MKTITKDTVRINTSTKSMHKFVSRPERTVEWLGGVTYGNLGYVIDRIKDLLRESNDEIHLVVNSSGGATGIGMGFFDAVRSWLLPDLVTIGSGDVDSSGVIVFLAGKKRYITKNTTMLLHMARRTWKADKCMTTKDMETMLKEDRLKDYQYACVVADATRGKYTPEKIIDLMREETILTADEAVNMGLAHKVI